MKQRENHWNRTASLAVLLASGFLLVAFVLLLDVEVGYANRTNLPSPLVGAALTPVEASSPILINAVIDPIPGSGELPLHVQSPGFIAPLVVPEAPHMPQVPGMAPRVDLDTLVVVYTDTAMGSMNDEDLLRLQHEITETAVFLWRHSYLKLRLNVTYLVINDYKDISEFTETSPNVYWLYPGDSDGDGESVENDLIAHGVFRDQYDSINYFWAHNGPFGMAYGGLGGLISWSLGLTGITMNPVPWWFWNVEGSTAFAHEFQHTIDFMFEASGYPEYFHADRPWDLPGAFGEGDFWVSGMHRWPVENWFVLREPWGSVVNALDVDSDGVPDSALGEFPTEALLGSSPAMRDSDGDRLEDQHEVMTGIFLSPSLVDSDYDSDGLVDGDDRYPLYVTEAQIVGRSHMLDGDPAQWDMLTAHITEQNAPLSVTVAANWDEDYLYLMVIEDRYAGILLQIDADNDGWFHGKDNYEIIVDASHPDPTDPGIVNRAHIWDSSDEIIDVMGVPMWDDDPSYPGERLVVESDIARYARAYGSGFLVQLGIPFNELTGMVPSEGSELGLLIAFDYLDRQGGTFARLWEKGAWVRLVLSRERDTTPPTSYMNALPPITHDESFLVTWSGEDAETGLSHYDVQYRDGESGQWTDWLRRTVTESATFTGEWGHTYYFRLRAWDRAGNVEAYPANGGNTWTEIVGNAPSNIYLPLAVKDYWSPPTLTFYGQQLDGEVLNLYSSNWSLCRNSSSGSSMWQGLEVGTVGATFESSGYVVQRVFLYFDTASLPMNARVLKATLHVYAGQHQNGSTTIHVVPSTASSSLTPADFGAIEFVSGGSVTPSAPNTWMTIDLNSTALSWIRQGDTTKLALIHYLDLADLEPAETNDVLVGLAESSETRPYLVVAYVLP